MRIGLIGKNSVEYVKKLLSIWDNNDSAVLIDYDTPPSIAVAMLSDTCVRKCYIEDTFKRLYEPVPTSCEITEYSIKESMPCILPKSVRDMYISRYDESEAAVIFSSGTTGNRKGISLSHRAISNNADSIIDYMKPSCEDTLYLNKKLTHCSSLVGELLVSLKSGSDIVLSQILVPPRVTFKNISEFNVSILCCNPTLVDLYVGEVEKGRDFPKSVKVIYTSGDIISKKAIEKAREAFKCPVYNVYGQTECGPRITAQTNSHCSGNSVGKPINNVQIRTDDNGEIIVKTNALYTGFINSDPVSSEWHHTGDIGYFDKKGELFITGRVDNMIVIDSHNLYPESIERIIVDNTNIDDCIVFKENEKLVCEYVGEEQDIGEITRIIKPFLMPYEFPKRYRRVAEISKNKNGKKLRKKFKEIFCE